MLPGIDIKTIGSCLLAIIFFTSCKTELPEDVAEAYAGLPEKIDFNFHIRPILSDRCFKCHGPDEKALKAELRLDLEATAFAKLKSGAGYAFVSGKPHKSAAVERILSHDPEFQMPPPKSNLSLTSTEKALIIKWIEQGAEWKKHWAFTPPKKTAIPTNKNTIWATNEIDHFILQKMENAGLKPSPPAPLETQLRRLTLDLTGLPPTLDEIDEFLSDNAPDAFEKAIDRLLASPHFGERMAMDWLDLARYADTHGYQDDGFRNTWPYRNWVIDAFNENMPYDQFVTEQLAGDLLPQPTDDQLIATCFNRNHPQSQEGGVVDEEYRVEYVADRTNTFGKAFLGLTMECARCHDHKYDPVSQKEYYSLFAFFNNNNDAGIVPYNGEAAPTLILLSEEVKTKLEKLRPQIDSLEKELLPENFIEDFKKWLNETRKNPKATLSKNEGLLADFDFEYDKEISLSRINLEKEPPKNINPKDSTIAYFNHAKNKLDANIWGHKDERPLFVEGKIGKGVQFVGDAGIRFNRDLDFDRNQPFAVSLWVKLLENGIEGPIFGKGNGDAEGYRGWLCKLNKDGTLSFQFNHVWPDNCIDLQTIDAIEAGAWTHIVLNYNGNSKASGIQIFINGKKPGVKVWKDNLQKSILHGTNKSNWWSHPFLIGIETRKSIKNVIMDELKIYKRQLSDIEIESLFLNNNIFNQLLQTPENKLSDEQESHLLETWLLRRFNEKYNKNLNAIIKLREAENQLLTDQPEIMVMKERDELRPTFILERGAYDAPAEAVMANTPQSLPEFPDTLPRNRLGLAKWLTDAKNPLTARVVVNRIWAMFFGKGLVETQEDFGSQGSLPTHPELLDWLAVDFMENDWNVKALIKKIVLSSTYRQSSLASETAREIDPQNIYYSHFPAHQLPAEIIRDQALAASGLLVRKIGGPSVYPYQPEGIWEALATRNAIKYKQQHGDSLYRRSIYTVWKRSAPPPSMLSFDAPDRYFCMVRRQKTSTPLQSLVLMNDPQFVEAARMLGERMIKETDGNVATKVTFAFRALTGRKPQEKELQILENLYDEQFQVFKKDLKKSKDWLSSGEYPMDKKLNKTELATCAFIASTIMNFDEFVIKH